MKDGGSSRCGSVSYGAHPVVSGLLVGLQNERVALASKDLNGVDSQGLYILTVDLDDNLLVK